MASDLLWVGVVGPDGSGKSTVAEEAVAELRSRGLRVAHTHGRPQTILRRAPPTHADPSAPQSGHQRSVFLSVAKYLLAAADFAATRFRLHGEDVWVSERPLLDYEVDTARYQLAAAAAPVVSLTNRVMKGPDIVLFFTGDPEVMATRKDELRATEIARQLERWNEVRRSRRIDIRPMVTTNGRTPAELGRQAADIIVEPRLRWRTAPVKPTRLDVRVAGRDLAALETYRPIRATARGADQVGRAAVRAALTRRTPSPDPGIDALVARLAEHGCRFTGVSAMASSTPGRWVVGLARNGRLRAVAKVGRQDDTGIERERQNLLLLQDAPLENITTPTPGSNIPVDGRCVLLTDAPGPPLAPVVDIDRAINTAATLGRRGWTHGDFAPWNLLTNADGDVVLVDWESAETQLHPLTDLVHYLLRLGATTHPAPARQALHELVSGHQRFRPVLEASELRGQQAARAAILTHLDQSDGDVMSRREEDLRVLLRNLINPRKH